MIFVSSCRRGRRTGSPWTSSSAPGASPTNIRSASGLPTPNTICVRPSVCSLQRVQSPMSVRIADQRLGAAIAHDADSPGCRVGELPRSAASARRSAPRRLPDRIAADAGRRRARLRSADVRRADRGPCAQSRLQAGGLQRPARCGRASRRLRRDRGYPRRRAPWSAAAAARSPSAPTIVTALVSTSKPASLATRRWRR